jgi:stearoyl-CoA desaturase (delta-9 desaturase)
MQLALLDLPWWGIVAATLAMTHITIAAVTIFLHRHQAHHALTLHPLASHFFRFWLWLTTGMVTREWVAIHRKHHAHCDAEEDPHSPQQRGLQKVLWQGAELYRDEAQKSETLARYGKGTPDDWLERRLYSPHSRLGVGILLVAEVALFGPIGLTVWAVQMVWIPLLAAGVINGVGHFWGYRSFATRDASRNIVPWGILIGGEELHNNHHAYAASARLSNRWWEFDAGWLYIRLLAATGLARVNRIAPQLRRRAALAQCDAETLQAICTHRFAVLAQFASALKRTAIRELQALRERGLNEARSLSLGHALRRRLQRDDVELAAGEQEALEQAIGASSVLQTIFAMRQELAALWSRTSESKEELVRRLEAWCQSAEASGIAALRDFSRDLRGFA